MFTFCKHQIDVIVFIHWKKSIFILCLLNYTLLPAAEYGENFSEVNENNEESVFELKFLEQTTFIWSINIPIVQKKW